MTQYRGRLLVLNRTTTGADGQERTVLMAGRRFLRRLDLSRQPVLRSVLGTFVLLLGLFGMHAGVGTGAVVAGIDTSVLSASQQLEPMVTGTSSLISEDVLMAQPPEGAAFGQGLPYCALEAGGDACASSLTVPSLVLDLAPREHTSFPGQGLTAPPLPWVVHFRLPWTPSLVQLAISRT